MFSFAADIPLWAALSMFSRPLLQRATPSIDRVQKRLETCFSRVQVVVALIVTEDGKDASDAHEAPTHEGAVARDRRFKTEIPAGDSLVAAGLSPIEELDEACSACRCSSHRLRHRNIAAAEMLSASPA